MISKPLTAKNRTPRLPMSSPTALSLRPNREFRKFIFKNCRKRFSSGLTIIRNRLLLSPAPKPPPFNRQINRLKKLISSGKKKNKWHWNRHGEQRKKLQRHKTRQ